MAKSILFLLLGYPGSGKTTTSKVLHELTGAVHLWADHERKRLFAHPTYSHQENLDLYKQLNQETDELLAAGNSVIFDTNFNFYRDREKLRRIAAKHGVKAYVVWVVTPKDVAKGRATQDAHKQHTRVLGDMPVEDFERMSGNLQKPRHDEDVIQLDGTDISPETVGKALRAAGALAA